jgi:hypothetical protein
VARVLASPHLQKSARLKEFLTYVNERTLSDPVASIGELEISERVFGRKCQEGEEDSIVRVHASQLRKRLIQYFDHEGASERVILEIPKGNYAPVFHARTKEAAPEAALPPVKPGPTVSRQAVIIATVISFLVAATGWLLWDDLRLRNDSAALSGENLTQFWSGFLRARLPLDIVLADSDLALLQNLANADITVEQYADRRAPSPVDSIGLNAEHRDIIRRYTGRRHTSMADVNLVRKISLLAGARPEKLQIIQARDLQSRQLATGQAILLGSKDANPWVELFEEKMNFKYTFVRRPSPEMLILNFKPRSGEDPVYRRDLAAARRIPGGYCVVARLPNLSGKGKVLLIGGTEMEATEAGGDFLLNENSLAALRKTLGLRPREPFSDFEALLATRRVGGTSPQAELIAVRRY